VRLFFRTQRRPQGKRPSVRRLRHGFGLDLALLEKVGQMKRYVAIVAVPGMALALSACGSSNTSMPSRSTSTPQGATGALHQISVTVEGVQFNGHCVGETPAGSPTVILESGLGGDQDTLQSIEEKLATRTMVCSYDRAGIGQSDPPSTTPGPLTDMVSDLHSFLATAKIEPPYLLVGQSLGANIVFMYAQAHPEDVSGFVSMNPVPPYTEWIDAAGKVETKSELHDNEIVFYQARTTSRSRSRVRT
jgi:pimeloyl-ACP methyl ester carboxylesterase